MKIDKFDDMVNDDIIHITGKFFNKNSVPVQNNINISNWFIKNSMTAYREGHIGLLKNLISELTELFGKSNKTIRLEFMTRVWILKYKNLTFNVFTAKGKGTSIEVCDFDYEDIRNGKYEAEIIEFLEKLYNLINTL